MQAEACMRIPLHPIYPQELATYLLRYFMGCVALVRCVLVLRCGSAVVEWYPYAGFSLHKDTTPPHPSSGARDLFVALFHGLCCSVRIEVIALASLFSGECSVVTCVVVLIIVFL